MTEAVAARHDVGATFRQPSTPTNSRAPANTPCDPEAEHRSLPRHPRESGDPVADTMLSAAARAISHVTALAPALDPRFRGDDDIISMGRRRFVWQKSRVRRISRITCICQPARNAHTDAPARYARPSLRGFRFARDLSRHPRLPSRTPAGVLELGGRKVAIMRIVMHVPQRKGSRRQCRRLPLRCPRHPALSP